MPNEMEANNMKISKAMRSSLIDAVFILIGEAVVGVAVALVYLLLEKFNISVVLGSLLGTAVVILNYLILAISVNRAVDKYMEKRGETEMTDEEAEAFAKENAASVSLAAQGTYVLRMGIMLASLVGAFLMNGVFDVIAALVPLIAYRPIIFVIELIRSKFRKEEV